MKLFGKRKPTRPPVRHILPPPGEQRPPVDVPQVPAGMWEKCVQCNNILYADDLQARLMTCPQCGYHFRLTARVRIELTADSGSFAELDADLTGHNPLDFPGYEDKLKTARAFTGLKDAVVTGTARISGQACVLAVMDGHFMMGSMGAAVGEKLTRAAEVATEKKLPLIAFTVSGGARMQEGMISLMQMARVSGAILTHSQAGLLYVVVLTDPTTGGVTASFAMQGDIILAEPGALIGFAGRRVIEQTTRSILPDGFQRAEFLMEKGFVDQIVPRAQMAQTLGRILLLHQKEVGT